MNVLVLGGTGFIGSNLCSALIKNGHSLRIIDRTLKMASFQNYPNVEIIERDFIDVSDFQPLLEEIDIVYHLISTTVPSTSNQDVQYDIASNVIPTLRLLNSIVNSNVKKIIYLSSGGTVYGHTELEQISEDHSTNPICSYGIQKLTIEKYLHFFYNQYGLDYSIVRLSNPYGIGQYGKNGQGVIPIFISKISNKEDIQIWGDGLATRDYIYIDDVTRALLLLSEYEGKNKVFNLGTGQGTTLLQIIDIISTLLEENPSISFYVERSIDVRRNVLDISRITRELNWTPEIDLVTGIKRMIEQNQHNLSERT